MKTAEHITESTRFRPDELLLNIPRPSGDCLTILWDYDQERFYQGLAEGARFFEQNMDKNASIKKLCDFIEEITIEESTATPLDRKALIMRSVGNWIPVETFMLNRGSPEFPGTIEVKVLKCEVTNEALSFCSHHGVLQYLLPTIDLIEKCFPSLQEDISLEIVEDPESDEEWLTFNIDVKGEVEEILEDYDNYTTMFVSEVPCPERDKFRLLYNIV
jgi:hypothetical protein